MVRILAIFLVFIFSCSVKKESCKLQIENLKQEQQKLPKSFKTKGLVYLKGLPAIFKGYFNKNEKISIFTPFGQKLASFEKNEDLVCIEFNGLKQCGKNLLSILDIDIPINLKNIILGKVDIENADKVYCSEEGVIVEKDNIKYIFEKNRLKKVIYQNYKLIYSYYEDKKVINVYDGDRKISSISIKSIDKI
ncbi:hypothetical protein [Hydrogenothermus marinus]|uniref:Lipoprotein n=1 Tax=Hydrogenothermus marinus TaxID=133270 RepID=A0A3M0C4S3_9AQUI|nr:hypothetical protein [Hydrogenothermus marinus]RMA97932.1 hypothetical protein CLV39_0568 [Hydrogenothermus marinus]